MKCTSLLPEGYCYSSVVWRESAIIPNIQFAVRRASLLQRIELTRRLRELTLHNEFLNAGGTPDQLQASLSDLQARKLYLEWGLAEVKGLSIDGVLADADLLIAKGPENLLEEMISAIRSETQLSEDERKNF